MVLFTISGSPWAISRPACFISELVLGPTSQGVHEHLQNLEIQVAKAAQLLACAADASRQLRDQCAEADSLDFTKSTTAALT